MQVSNSKKYQKVGQSNRRKILFVALADSVHTARWIAMLTNLNCEIHVFAMTHQEGVHSLLQNVCLHGEWTHNRPQGLQSSVKVFSYWPFRRGALTFRRIVNVFTPLIKCVRFYRVLPSWIYAFSQVPAEHRLAKLIDELKPDLVHSLETQGAGYLTLKARALLSDRFPKWAVSNWGSDIFLYGRLPAHHVRIREIMQTADYYFCECHRDIELAQRFGFKGLSFKNHPNGGGLDLQKVAKMRGQLPTSKRKLILVKGYQHWAGRALVALRALELCADHLKAYKVFVYAPSGDDVRIKCDLLRVEKALDISYSHGFISHEEILQLQAQARISIGLSISDAMSTCFLEAIAMGSFPIQSDSCCGAEIVQNLIGALYVPAEDPELVAKAIRHALKDDQLVDRAASCNWPVVQDFMDEKKITQQVLNYYQQCLDIAKF